MRSVLERVVSSCLKHGSELRQMSPGAHEKESPSPPPGLYPSTGVDRAKRQGGNAHPIKRLKHDIDGPLISMHKIKLNNGGRVQFLVE